MKNNVFISTLIALVAISSCSKAEYGNRQEPHESTLKKEGRKVLLCDNFVGIDQIKHYADKAKPATKTEAGTSYSVMPYCGSDGDTLMYIVNYGNGDGWQILSSDARTPAIIAEGENGSFSVENGSPAVQVWLDCTAADIAAVRRASDEELSFSAEDIEANRAVWGKGGTRVLPDPGDENGHWETVLVSTQSMVGEELEHMTPQWTQWAPYNAYAPFKYGESGRAPAGCVAIAASVVLYYLHNKWDVPHSMVCEGYSIGNVYFDDCYFGGSSTSIWSEMSPQHIWSPDSADAEALMIGYVGRMVDTDYGNSGSGAMMSKIRTQLFPIYGIDCEQGSYNVNAVKNNLKNHMPVIVSASDFLIPVDNNHCFVIDGYRKTFTRRTYYHYWVEDIPDPNPKSLPNHNPYYTYTDTTPTITSIKINWGWSTQWGSNPDNDGWFSLTPDWTVTLGDDTFNYNYYVTMLYDFCLTE